MKILISFTFILYYIKISLRQVIFLADKLCNRNNELNDLKVDGYKLNIKETGSDNFRFMWSVLI